MSEYQETLNKLCDLATSNGDCLNYVIALSWNIKQGLDKLEKLEKENQELADTLELYNEKFAGHERVKVDLIKENQELKLDNKILKGMYEDVRTTANFYMSKCEKLKKAIEIILKYDIDLLKVKQFSYEGYVGYCNFMNLLIPTQEEYDLLEEVVCYGKI